VRAARRAAKFYAGWLPTLAVGAGQDPRSYPEFGSLAAHVRYVERTSRKLARWTFYGMARWQGGLEQKQVYLARLVDIGAELFAMTAACVHAYALAHPEESGRTFDQTGGDASNAIELADAFCGQARLRVAALFTGLRHNTDTADRRLARSVVAGEFDWQEAGLVDHPDDRPWIASSDANGARPANVHRNPLRIS
jgi:hypothetical protein